jgi:peptidoglycan/LPS O-acetylase OafA/YrhL
VAALTGLRGLAAASVVFYHVWYYGAPGAQSFPAGPLEVPFAKLDLGVTFFFVLSGFLLFRPYARALLSDSAWPPLRSFAIARFLRIVPVYWAIVLAVAALAERSLFEQPWRLLANLFFLEFWFPSFLPDDLRTSNGSIAIVPSWALVVELGFYLTLPLLCLLAGRMARATDRRVLAASLPAAILFLVGAASIVVEHSLDGDFRRAWEFNFPMHASAFACGMAGTTIWVLWEQGRIRLPARWQLPTALVALAIALPPLKLVSGGQITLADSRGLVAISFGLLLLLVVLSPDASRVRSLLGARLLVLTGLASYSIFLVHDTIVRSIRSHDVASASVGGFLVTLLLVGAATAAATVVSYRFLEKPCFALKRRLTQGPTAEPIQPLLERLVSDIDPARARDFTIETAPASQPVEPRVLSPILTPLLRNAVAYGAAPYVVRAGVSDETLRLVVEDAGRGIEEEFVPRLFEPYSRSETSSRLPGAGLGLASARQTARDHGGDVVYEAPAEGGARFAVTLPVRRPRSGAARLVTGVASPRQRHDARSTPRPTPTSYCLHG